MRGIITMFLKNCLGEVWVWWPEC